MKAMLLLLCLILGFCVHPGAFAQVREWVISYNGPGNGEDVATEAAVGPDGSVVITGQSNGGGTGLDFLTIKYSTEGSQEWLQRYNGPGNGEDAANDIIIDEGGNIYITGYSEGSGTGSDATTIKYSPDGTQLWVARYNGIITTQDDEGLNLTLDASGNVYVAGRSSNSGIYFDWDYITIKYDSDGTQLWASRYNGPGDDWDQANSVAVDADGNVYVTGTQAFDVGTAYHDYATLKYNSSGVLQWIKTLDGMGHNWDEGTSIGLDQAGNIYMTGFTTGNGTVYDVVTIKYDPNGDERWMRSYNTQGTPSADVPFDMIVTDDGDVYITGANSLNMGTIKYNALGDLEWTATYNNGNFDAGYGIALDPAGNVIVAGVSSTGILESRYDYIVAMYNSDGEEQWVERYNAAANNRDEAWDVAVDLAGNIYVTGSTTGTGFDMTTIRYSTEAAIQCNEITTFVARCNNSGVVQAQVSLRNSIIHAGESVTFTVDGESHDVVIETNGTHSRAQLSVPGLPPGLHTVELTSPSSCFEPIDVNCNVSIPVSDLTWDEEGWGEVSTRGSNSSTEQSFQLDSYPNPFNPSTTIRFQVQSEGLVQLKVYDALGREVSTLVDGVMKEGQHEVVLDGGQLASGMYYARLLSGGKTLVRSLLLTK